MTQMVQGKGKFGKQAGKRRGRGRHSWLQRGEPTKRHQASTLQLLAGELAGIGVSGPITGAIQSPLQRAEIPLLGAEQSMILLVRIFIGDEAAALCYVSGTMNGV